MSFDERAMMACLGRARVARMATVCPDGRPHLVPVTFALRVFLGRLWRYEKQGLSPREMSDLEVLPASGWVSNYRSLVRVLRDGEIPKSPSMSLQGARRVRSWLKKLDVSTGLRADLAEQELLFMSRAEAKQAQTEEVRDAVEAPKAAESVGKPG